MANGMSVITRLGVIGFHQWDNAPEEVAYLRHPHRHVFGIRVEVRVRLQDREVEFHMLNRDLRKVLEEKFETDEGLEHGEYQFGGQSCEMIGHTIGEALQAHPYRYNVLSVEVDEDGENTSRLWWSVV